MFAEHACKMWTSFENKNINKFKLGMENNGATGSNHSSISKRS